MPYEKKPRINLRGGKTMRSMSYQLSLAIVDTCEQFKTPGCLRQIEDYSSSQFDGDFD